MQTFQSAVVEVRDPATTNPTGQRSPIAPHAIAVGGGNFSVTVRWGGAHWQVLMSIYPPTILLCDRIFFLLFLLLLKV